MLNLNLLFLPGLDWLSYCNYILFQKKRHFYYYYFYFTDTFSVCFLNTGVNTFPPSRLSTFADVLQNSCSLNFCKIHRKTPVSECLLNKVVCFYPATLLKEKTPMQVDGERRERGEYSLGFWEISSRIPRNLTFWGMFKKILGNDQKDYVDVKEQLLWGETGR